MTMQVPATLNFENGVLKTVTLSGNDFKSLFDPSSSFDFKLQENIIVKPTNTTSILENLNFKKSLLGYKYILTAIPLIAENPKYLKNIVTCLYKKIAKEHNTTTSRAERAMRHSIEVSWKRCSPQTWQENLGVKPQKRPTVSEFLALVADKS
jgi:hypothetical protein